MGSCQKGHWIMTSEPPLCELFWASPVFAWRFRAPRPFVPASSPGSLRGILLLLFPQWPTPLGGRGREWDLPRADPGRREALEVATERGLAFWGKGSVTFSPSTQSP